jgi:hypothetical protein
MPGDIPKSPFLRRTLKIFGSSFSREAKRDLSKVR